MKKKTWITILIIAVVGTGVYLYITSSKNKNKIIAWRISKIERGDILITVTATGSINALTTVQVGTQVSGTISKLFVDFNSVVKAGQIIAMLDTTFLAASREDAEAIVDKASSQLEQAKREFERTKKLVDEKVQAQADYDLSLSNYETAKSLYKSAKAQLNRANINLQYATIKAPIAGTVISRNVDVGQTVISSFNSPTLFTIANDLTKMQVQANIDEADIGQVKTGQKVSFTVDAYPNEVFEGAVKQIRLQPTIVQNVVNYIVIIDVPNPDLKLMPGLTANINVKIQEHKNVLRTQVNAIHFTPPTNYFKTTVVNDSVKKSWQAYEQYAAIRQEQMLEVDTTTSAYVWMQKATYIYPTRVSTGISDGTFIEISGNIHEGDELITGVNHEDPNASATSTQNPFMPKFPTRQKNK